ncbi:MAG: AEC family transporter [Fluviibacter sp.]
MDLFIRILEVIFPVVAVVGVGAWAGRRHQPEMAVANQLNMDYFVPAMVFVVLANGDFQVGEYAWLAAGAAFSIFASGLIGVFTARGLHEAPKTLALPIMINNSGNLGIPLAMLAFGQSGVAAAVVLFLVSNIIHFTMGPWILDHQAKVSAVWKTPVVVAAALGLVCNMAGLHIWAPLLMALRMLGDISVPLMLFALGVRLCDVQFSESRSALIAAVVRPVAGMLTGALAGWALGLPEALTAQLILFGSLPPAVMNYMFAERYNQEPQKVASIVMIGNIAALLFIPIALLIVLPR